MILKSSTRLFSFIVPGDNSLRLWDNAHCSARFGVMIAAIIYVGNEILVIIKITAWNEIISFRGDIRYYMRAVGTLIRRGVFG